MSFFGRTGLLALLALLIFLGVFLPFTGPMEGLFLSTNQEWSLSRWRDCTLAQAVTFVAKNGTNIVNSSSPIDVFHELSKIAVPKSPVRTLKAAPPPLLPLRLIRSKPSMANEIKEAMEGNDIPAKIDAMKKAVMLLLNGETPAPSADWSTGR